MNAELIARLEAAEVGSMEFDGEVSAATVGWLEHDGSPITTSIDAVIALAERVLSSKEWMIVKSTEGVTAEYAVAFIPETFGYGATAPLAACAAILRALDAQEQK